MKNSRNSSKTSCLKMKMNKAGLFLTAAFLLVACGTSSTQTDNQADPNLIAPHNEVAKQGTNFKFIVLGDTPYSKSDEEMLAKATPIIRQGLDSGTYPFVVHVGDYKGGKAPCVAQYDEAQRKLIDALSPIFYTPGDNEWTDCDRNINEATGELYSDLDRLETVRNLFFATDDPAHAAFGTQSQVGMRENKTWVYDSVRFATVHIAGTNHGRDWVTGDSLESAKAAAEERERYNLEWINGVFDRAESEQAEAVILTGHADMNDIKGKPADVMCNTVAKDNKNPCDAYTDFRKTIQKRSLSYGKPVLLMYGDTEAYTLRQKFSGEEAPNLWLFNAPGDTGPGYGVNDVAEVHVDLSATPPFTAKGLLTGKLPKTR